MNKREKEILQLQLQAEEDIIHELEKQYKASLNEINQKVKLFEADIRLLDEAINEDGLDEAAKAMLQSQRRSKVYQKQFQEALQGQINGILDRMQGNNYSSIESYLKGCYEDAFVGTMYNIHGQGIPLIMPIDQAAAVKAIMTDSKISKGLYNSLGVDVKGLKKSIRQEITRGIGSGLSYSDIARNIANTTKAPLSRAKTIVRTEGHRIQQQSADDARRGAIKRGCDVVKQWDSTLDGKTRPNHRRLDGQIREEDEPFEVAGMKAMFPGEFGDPAEDCNCRCVALTRARWALDEDELQTLKDRAEYFGLLNDGNKQQSFKDFETKYLKAVEEIPERGSDKFVPAKTIEEAEAFAKQIGVKYVDYSKLPIETANRLNEAITTLPEDVRPVFVGDSTTLEKYWGGKLPKSSRNYYGVTMQTYGGIHLGYGQGYDFDTEGYMVGISSSYKTSAKITAAKLKAQLAYQEKYGTKWFFNENGEATPFHEIGHVYANVKGLPKGFEEAAERWAKESGCDMLKKPSEAWAEAWGAYFTSNKELPGYIAEYIKSASATNPGKIVKNSLIDFDDNAIINAKIKEFSDNLLAGAIRTTISPQKQSRHIYGSKEFIAYSDKLSSRGDHPSYIKEDISIKDLDALIKDKLGTGIIEVKNDNSIQEFFDCDEIVGYWYDKESGEYKPTKRVQVKYSLGDGNIHVIPVRGK